MRLKRFIKNIWTDPIITFAGGVVSTIIVMVDFEIQFKSYENLTG